MKLATTCGQIDRGKIIEFLQQLVAEIPGAITANSDNLPTLPVGSTTFGRQPGSAGPQCPLNQIKAGLMNGR